MGWLCILENIEKICIFTSQGSERQDVDSLLEKYDCRSRYSTTRFPISIAKLIPYLEIVLQTEGVDACT
jgi:hypothetical protein